MLRHKVCFGEEEKKNRGQRAPGTLLLGTQRHKRDRDNGMNLIYKNKKKQNKRVSFKCVLNWEPKDLSGHCFSDKMRKLHHSWVLREYGEDKYLFSLQGEKAKRTKVV